MPHFARHYLAAALLLPACDPAAPAQAKPAAAVTCGPLDSTLRLNQLQVLGTHNSYHVARKPTLDPSLAYTHLPLRQQLEKQGVRHFELDLHRKPNQPFQVFHLPVIDAETTCLGLQDCLGELRTWSDEHPCHQPLFVLFEPKDEIDEDKLTGQWDALEAELLQVFPRERMVTPDDVRGAHVDVRTAITTTGWPTLAATRGKIVFVLMDKTIGEDVSVAEDYRKDHPKMAGRLMFLFGEPTDPDIAFVKRNDPSDVDEITSMVKQGYMMRGTVEGGDPQDHALDGPRRAAALAVLHLVTTDFPRAGTDMSGAAADGWTVTLPGGTPSRCHPLSAPKDCTAEAVEHLQ